MRHEINLRELRMLCEEFPWLLGKKVTVNDIVLCALKPEYISDVEQPTTFGQVCRLLCWFVFCLRVLCNSINNMHININAGDFRGEGGETGKDKGQATPGRPIGRYIHMDLGHWQNASRRTEKFVNPFCFYL